MKLFCTCKRAEVTHGDSVELSQGIVAVHGLHHCYVYHSKFPAPHSHGETQ